jgi:phage terminase large subunit GpA-like protein
MSNQVETQEILNVLREAFKTVRPPKKLTCSEFADKHRILSTEVSAESGRWRTHRTEYLREIMDEVCSNEVDSAETVVFMASAQVGKTEAILNILLKWIYQGSPLMVLVPTLDMARQFSRTRLEAMLRDTDILKDLMYDPKEQEGKSTDLYRQGRNGSSIAIVGGNSPVGLSAKSVRYVLADEVDRLPLTTKGDEGSPLELAFKRCVSYWDRKKFIVSTPTIKDFSKIEEYFLLGDQRRFFVPLGCCSKEQILKWSNVQWPKDRPEEAVYVCDKCGAINNDLDLNRAVKKGKWIPTGDTTKKNRIKSYHINELYSPFSKIGEMATEFLKAKKAGKQALKTFINTSLGETWEDENISFGDINLDKKREDYIAEDGIINCSGDFIVAGIDVQADRLEMSVGIWGQGFESWQIDYHIIYGNLSTVDPWSKLMEKASKIYTNKEGTRIRIACTFIDSGYLTDEVYRFCAEAYQLGFNIYPIKGLNVPGQPIVGRPSKSNRFRVNLFPIGTDTAKDIIFSRLQLKGNGDGCMHFPNHPKFDEEYFKQLLSEKKIIRNGKRSWEKIRARNEVLDTIVYQLAAIEFINPIFKERSDFCEKEEQQCLNLESGETTINSIALH